MTETTVPTPGGGATPTVQFNAQGTFSNNGGKTLTFHDVTNEGSTLWFSANPNGSFTGKATYNGNGQWSGITQGCTCLAVTAGGIESQTLTLGVATPAAACTPCPQVTP